MKAPVSRDSAVLFGWARKVTDFLLQVMKEDGEDLQMIAIVSRTTDVIEQLRDRNNVAGLRMVCSDLEEMVDGLSPENIRRLEKSFT